MSTFSARSVAPHIVPLHRPIDVEAEGPEPTGSEVLVDIEAVFTNGDTTHRIRGFYAGSGIYRVRFLPQVLGAWTYAVFCGAPIGETDPVMEGSFTCTAPEPHDHGPVRTDGMGFRHADGTVFTPFGTTAYAWHHQTAALREQTLATLEASPFTKLRMCVLPKSMAYNSQEPKRFPFRRDSDGRWDVHRPDHDFWDELDRAIEGLGRCGVQADLILFHPYDRWGFASLPLDDCLIYLEHCVRRLSAHPHLWWSLANEYDMMFDRSPSDWDALGERLASLDPYGHPLSVHNWLEPFDASRSWVTHCSIQTSAVHRVDDWRQEHRRPVIVDECGYEGDLEENWGQLSARELVHRLWAVTLKGGYGTHGETFFAHNEVIWWAKGGVLHGESPPRIAFLREIVEGLGGDLEPEPARYAADPNVALADEDVAHRSTRHLAALRRLDAIGWEDFRAGTTTYRASVGDDQRIAYLGRSCQAVLHLDLPEDTCWRIELIDTWDMTRTPVAGVRTGRTRVELPGREGIALLATRIHDVEAGQGDAVLEHN